ncbi:hypothetical protein BT69DRAFT_1097652 [Atractiella rhizophila]|nr:hypothetical protein BT69DRAFT_1097652 [Atractiella rhizophila]
MRRVRRRVTPADDTTQSAASSQTMTEEQPSSPYQDSQEPTSSALVHVITTEHYPDSIHLSILPSFLSRLPPSIHMLQISFALSGSFGRWNFVRMSSKLSHLSLERVHNAVNKDGAINLHIIINSEGVSVTFLDVEGHTSSVERDIKSKINPLASYGESNTRTFPFFRENAIFASIATWSAPKGPFLPIGDDESSTVPSLGTASIIQLSVPPPDIPCTILRLPIELLSLTFSFYHGDPSILSKVCQLWRTVSAPYWGEPDSVVEKYEQLKRYPGAGRLWNQLWFGGVDVGTAEEVIASSPNVMEVRMGAFWNDEEVKIVLNAIEGLKWVDDVTFAQWGPRKRKWKKEEIENFVRRMGDRIRRLNVYDVEESPASASEGIRLSSQLEYLVLDKYPPVSSLSLPHTLKRLQLSNMCPLPSSISDYPLPPLLEHVEIELAPFSTNGKPTILPTPLDLSHLTHLTQLILDGGEETSNLVSRQFFSTIKNATAIYHIRLCYCVVDSSDFPDFIRWFFGDWRVRGIEKGHLGDGEKIGKHLEVRLFFGEWSQEEIEVGRGMMRKYPGYESGIWGNMPGIWEPAEGKE